MVCLGLVQVTFYTAGCHKGGMQSANYIENTSGGIVYTRNFNANQSGMLLHKISSKKGLSVEVVLETYSPGGNKMGDPLPSRLALPKLKYKIGSEPKKTISINQHLIVGNINTVKDILGDDEFNRIRGTFWDR
ncbi:hypothetical protein Bca52824_017402 [Brassica carinata]|uniref:Uncharacterized protein n=1 Tax=Brassica carinata TaxID=52824 RepID=A0A8X7VP08_BRACI|nr:hypothetical protein Bca52824_017402 [Brassica carinata]